MLAVSSSTCFILNSLAATGVLKLATVPYRYTLLLKFQISGVLVESNHNINPLTIKLPLYIRPLATVSPITDVGYHSASIHCNAVPP
ncbi:hypothetical protein GW750_01655 [bacterium]|nr:hypothetical protein [bacterium]